MRSIEDDGAFFSTVTAEAALASMRKAGFTAGEEAASSEMTSNAASPDARTAAERANGGLVMVQLPRVTVGALSGTGCARVLKET